MNIVKPDEPAFASLHTPWLKGLTKREYFAAMAMQGLLANKSAHQMTIEMITESAVRLTDALIEELNKTK